MQGFENCFVLDTPGINDSMQEAISETIDSFDLADLYIVVISCAASKANNESGKDILLELLKNKNKFVILLHKTDLHINLQLNLQFEHTKNMPLSTRWGTLSNSGLVSSQKKAAA